MTHRVTSDEISRARDIHLIDYLEAKGEPIKSEGVRQRFYRHQEHDSLVFKDNMYYWNSRQEKGVGAISFAMMYYDMTFPEAVTDINDGNYKDRMLEKQEQRKETSAEPFSYPDFLEVKDHSSVKNYLIVQRKIDPRIVDWLFKKDLLAQDKKLNAVFKWRENGGKGKIVGADRQGTIKMQNKRGTFKQIMPNGKEHCGFTIDVGRPNKIIAFESPIDMLSYWSIKGRELQDARLVSMSGLKPKTIIQSHLEAAEEGYKIKKWMLAVDNDSSGLEFVEKIKAMVKEEILEVDLPTKKGNDWNDERRGQVVKLNQAQGLHIAGSTLEK
ncbi:toprim domain-containing protein [Fictibacillus enclensis]|uniref:toprim domain-containing protein n=1 Tax=Fictibacillus enclensis TaxID=1017270 RepID=UPI0025A25EE8|nr:toprim domain-containing protein [Fictibacillus enclensis]MDM5196514.1 toprim domain-containing protein [Fictibacillus enclensis]